MRKIILCAGVTAIMLLGACSKKDMEQPKDEMDSVMVDAKANAKEKKNELTGKWINVSHEYIGVNGKTKVYTVEPDDYFNFINASQLSFSTALLGAVQNASYSITNGNITIQYKLYGGSVDGKKVIEVPYVYIFPLEFDENGLWVISFSDDAGNKTIFKYKRQ